ncbi:hypothetical protein PRUPE_1G191300 [Prunus persica]|uniref:Uncharacterized protein n=1 Tax=Prunus persica TaxID=3760 RepID=M5XP17_PRUPE|nr:hypothetical protein PRUPE_1G191300 [Prunus persica]
MTYGGLAVRGGLVIDVADLHPLEFSKAARSSRPMSICSFLLVRCTRPTCRVFIGQMSSVCAERQHHIILCHKNFNGTLNFNKNEFVEEAQNLG